MRQWIYGAAEGAGNHRTRNAGEMAIVAPEGVGGKDSGAQVKSLPDVEVFQSSNSVVIQERTTTVLAVTEDEVFALPQKLELTRGATWKLAFERYSLATENCPKGQLWDRWNT